MSGKDSTHVTLAHVDPSIVSCWDKMVKRNRECSLLLKHSKGKVIATLQCTTPIKTTTSSNFSTPSAEEEKKKKKRKGCKKRKLEKLLAYHQRLVAEKGLPPSRLMEEHAALSVSPSTKITSEKQFKCDQCDFGSDTQRGLKVHVGRSHKESEVLRAEEHDVSLALSELSEVRDDDSNVKADNSFLGVVNEDPPEPAHPHSVWVFCPKAECKVKKMRVEIDIMHKRRCKKCGARNQDNCTCRSCEDCNEGNCCINCVCCDSRHDPLTEEEILLNGGCLKCMQ